MMMWGGAPLRALEPLQAPIQVLHLRGDDFHHVYNEHDEIAVESPSSRGQGDSPDSLHSLFSDQTNAFPQPDTSFHSAARCASPAR